MSDVIINITELSKDPILRRIADEEAQRLYDNLPRTLTNEDHGKLAEYLKKKYGL